MAAWATEAELEAYLGGQSWHHYIDRDGDGRPDSAAVSAALAAAADIVTAILAPTTDVTASPITEGLKQDSMVIATYNLAGDLTTETLHERYHEVVDRLKNRVDAELALKKMGLTPAGGGGSTGPTGPDDLSGDVYSHTSPRELTRKTLKGVI